MSYLARASSKRNLKIPQRKKKNYEERKKN